MTPRRKYTAMLLFAIKTQVQPGISVCGKRGYWLLTLRFLAGQSTGPAGAPFSDPALTAATNARDRTRANFIFCLSLVLFDTFQMFRVMATSDGGVSGTWWGMGPLMPPPRWLVCCCEIEPPSFSISYKMKECPRLLLPSRIQCYLDARGSIQCYLDARGINTMLSPC